MEIEKVNEEVKQKCTALSIAPPERFIWVSIREQRLRFIEGTKPILDLVASTSKQPPSCVHDSLGTPLGLHCIGAKIGDNAPVGSVFKGRQKVADHYNLLPPEDQQTNLITTRILRLRGIEPELNAIPGHNAWERYVYIHGTNREAQLGTPFSAGCVLLANAPLVELFDLVEEGVLVWVTLD